MYFQSIILSVKKINTIGEELNNYFNTSLNIYLQNNNITTSKENIITFNTEKSSIGINDIANLNKNIYTKNDEIKIIVVEEADKMTEEAQNAFLKTLEEPNDNLLIILITINAEKLLPTIRSRCIEINLSSFQNPAVESKSNDIQFKFLNSNYIERKNIIESILKEDNPREFALDLILYIINNIKLNKPNLSDEIIHVYRSIKQGANLKLALENISILLI